MSAWPALALLALALPALAGPAGFAVLCAAPSSTETAKTASVLLEVAGATDCAAAADRLEGMRELDLAAEFPGWKYAFQ